MDRIGKWVDGVDHQEYGEDLIVLLTYEGKVIKTWYSDIEEVRVKADMIQHMTSDLMKNKFHRTGYRLHHFKEETGYVITEEIEEFYTDD